MELSACVHLSASWPWWVQHAHLPHAPTTMSCCDSLHCQLPEITRKMGLQWRLSLLGWLKWKDLLAECGLIPWVDILGCIFLKKEANRRVASPTPCYMILDILCFRHLLPWHPHHGGLHLRTEGQNKTFTCPLLLSVIISYITVRKTANAIGLRLSPTLLVLWNS